MAMTLQEVLEYGPIVHMDEDYGFLITINGAYLNFWSGCDNSWENTDCRYRDKDLYQTTVAQALDLAEEWAEEILNTCHECGEMSVNCACDKDYHVCNQVGGCPKCDIES